jgi:hypothetical protein
MSSQNNRNNETRTSNYDQKEPFNKRNPNEPVEASKENLDKTQDNQKKASGQNNPQSKTGPAEGLRAEAAEDQSDDDSKEPAA